jgi:hypothetical protein
MDAFLSTKFPKLSWVLSNCIYKIILLCQPCDQLRCFHVDSSDSSKVCIKAALPSLFEIQKGLETDKANSRNLMSPSFRIGGGAARYPCSYEAIILQRNGSVFPPKDWFILMSAGFKQPASVLCFAWKKLLGLVNKNIKEYAGFITWRTSVTSLLIAIF